MEGRIVEHRFPLAMTTRTKTALANARIEYSWHLYLNGKLVARSHDYFRTSEEAETALSEFLDSASDAPVRTDLP